MIVDADLEEVRILRDLRARRGRLHHVGGVAARDRLKEPLRRREAAVAEIQVVVLGLDRPLPRQHALRTDAQHPPEAGIPARRRRRPGKVVGCGLQLSVQPGTARFAVEQCAAVRPDDPAEARGKRGE